jgi:hypothetical protein
MVYDKERLNISKNSKPKKDCSENFYWNKKEKQLSFPEVPLSI